MFTTLNFTKTFFWSNLLLALATIFALIFLTREFFFDSPESQFRKILSEARQASSSVKAASSDAVEKIPEISFYEEIVSKKPVFRVLAQDAAPTNLPGTLSQDAFEGLVLVGILPGASPQAILENTKTQRTFYLSSGESSDGVQVEEIGGDSVTLGSGLSQKKLSL